MNRTFLTAFAFGILGLTSVAHSTEYVTGAPLKDTLQPKVEACRLGKTTQVPLITWGADIVTLYGNGNKLKTASDSVFGELGLNLELKREDRFSKQLEAYMRCDTPFLRGTQGMINMAADLTEASPMTSMIAIYQHSWSNGGDALVVRSGINSPADLRGKTIAVQAYGPHVDYMARVLGDAGIKVSEVKIKWLENLTGNNSPSHALANDKSIHAAFVISPDALRLTSGGGVGTGAEGSISGAKILVSTKTASRIISDVYVVRRDFYKANPVLVQNFVHGLLMAEELTREAMKAGDSQLIAQAGQVLLGDSSAVEDVKGLWSDSETVGWRGNVTWSQANSLRGWLALNNEAQSAFVTLGLLSQTYNIANAPFDYNALKEGLSDTSGVQAPRFDEAKLQGVINKRMSQGVKDDGTLFEFEVNFKPNQTAFNLAVYEAEFNRVIELAATYGGAVITIEGHADPLNFLQKKKANAPSMDLRRIKQSAKSLSVTRALEVREAVVLLAEQKGIPMDASQFATIGAGIADPKTGMCGEDPCAPKTEAEWHSNMRVVFRILQLEAEAEVFRPLN